MFRLVWVLVFALVASFGSASGVLALPAKTALRGNFEITPVCVRGVSSQACGMRRENRAVGTVVASECCHAARGGLRPIARTLSSAGDDLLLKKAVNSNLPHAIERGVERGIFQTAEEAGTALRSLAQEITQSGFPAGTLVDTARAGRFLVPTGNNGLAVYQLAANGTAKLKTLLNAR